MVPNLLPSPVAGPVLLLLSYIVYNTLIKQRTIRLARSLLLKEGILIDSVGTIASVPMRQPLDKKFNQANLNPPNLMVRLDGRALNALIIFGLPLFFRHGEIPPVSQNNVGKCGNKVPAAPDNFETQPEGKECKRCFLLLCFFLWPFGVF